MKVLATRVLMASTLVVCVPACSSGSDQSTAEMESSSTSAEVEVAEEPVSEEPVVVETTIEEPQSDSTSGTIATSKVGYGHFADSVYLEQVQKNMNGRQRDEYSEAQLFNYARNTCTYLREGNWLKMIELMEGLQDSQDYEFIASMTLLAIYAYCPESENPFMEEAKKRGL